MSEAASQPRRRQGAPRRPPPEGRRRRKKKKVKVPTVDVHVQVGLVDMLMRISAADFQRFINHWVLSEETVIFRGPYNGMETDLVVRGGASGMYSVRSYPEGGPRPKIHLFKLVVADEVRMEMLENAGF